MVAITNRLERALLALLAASAAPAWAQPLRLSPETQAALVQFEAGSGKLALAREAATALAAGDRPRGAPRDWEGLAEAFQAAARAAQRADGPLLPELPAPVAPEQLRSCATRAAAVTRGDRAVKSLQAVAQRCAETRAQLRERVAAAQATEEGWRALVRTLAGLPESSGVAGLFPGRWAAQEAPVAAAQATYREALARQATSVERNLAELRGRAGSLGAAVSRARDCLLAGRWAGASSHAGTVSGVTLELTADGSAWVGSANLGGVRVPVRAVAVNGTSVVISLAEGHSLTGTLTADGLTYSGTHSSSEGPAAFALHRQ